jgi:hypothetical protein
VDPTSTSTPTPTPTPTSTEAPSPAPDEGARPQGGGIPDGQSEGTPKAQPPTSPQE